LAQASSAPAKEFLRNLENANDDAEATAEAFLKACSDRGDAFLPDVLEIVSLNRKLASDLTVFEFEATMPVDDLNPAKGTRLDPNTCELTKNFVSAKLVESDPS
jgi:hypothetical protein